MRLEAFGIQNSKKIRDTGWVSCRDLTVFVGKNEASKSAILRGLSNLNPSDGEPFEEKMQRLTGTLAEQFAESAELEKAIRTNLRGLGHGR